MSGNAMKRAFYLKRLFHEYMADAPEEFDTPERHRYAHKKMCEELGPEWKDEVNPDGVEFISLEFEESEEDLSDFYDRVHEAGYLDHDLGEGPDAPPPEMELDVIFKRLYGKR